jgi:hypothetical protein
MAEADCPICKSVARIEMWGDRLVFRVNCEICGDYDITTMLMSMLRALNPIEQADLTYLSTATRRAATPLMLSADNWEDLLDAQRNTSVTQKLRRLLELVADRTAAPGVWVRFNWRADLPIVAARDKTEFGFLIQHLLAERLLEDRTDTVAAGKDVQVYRLTVKGIETVSPLSIGTPGTCFVAMSFDKTMDAAYETGIVPSVETDCQFTVVRIDRVHHNDVITDKIIASIRSAQFVVADFTLQRAGVYYEAGFALGLGRPVVWTCREDDRDKLHFDTRQFNHVIWTTPDDLRTQLTDRIRATIPGAKLEN